jgi:pantoate--beta-alanine ligase
VKLIRTGAEWNPLWLNHLQKNHQLGLVPTMGALHDGHLELVRKSRRLTDVTVVSIFVNPSQFNNPEDFAKYPSMLETDLEKLASEGVDYVFAPEVAEVYPSPTKLKFDFGDLENVLEGKFRPGHFNGVGIVVSKLFHILRPHIAFFGQKDLQQVSIIRCLVKDLSFDIMLEIVSTKREPNGLAMSSRNARLNSEEREKALILYKSLEKAKAGLLDGTSWKEIQKSVAADFEDEPSVNLEYFELVNPETFEVFPEFVKSQRSSICVAAFIGTTRLIDNLPINH